MVITKVLANWAFTWEGIHPSLPEGVGLCLDVGCGDGRHCDLVEKAGWDWIGLDVDSERGGGNNSRGWYSNTFFGRKLRDGFIMAGVGASS